MNTHTKESARLYPLDVLRGVAALSVVFWHWQHFFYAGDKPAVFDIVRQPFYDSFSLLYRYGALAVELFFVISGFVFFYLFFNAIAERRIKASRFFMDRFSRLYPLHILSFAAVAILQYVYIQEHSAYFIYQFNDLYHALLNTLLIPAWGFERGWSFNGPVWSVSVEMFLYGLFFLVCLTGRARSLLSLGLIAVAGFLYADYHKLSAGVFSFFSGGVAYLLMEKLRHRLGGKPTCAVALLIAVAAWMGIWLGPGLNIHVLMGIAFPAMVMFIASLSYISPNFLKPLGAIGDLSYSSYLLHFPLQIVFALSFDRLGYTRDIFYSPGMLLLFMAVLIPLSLASHRWFEVPVQSALRTRFKTRSGKGSSAIG